MGMFLKAMMRQFMELEDCQLDGENSGDVITLLTSIRDEIDGVLEGKGGMDRNENSDA